MDLYIEYKTRLEGMTKSEEIKEKRIGLVQSHLTSHLYSVLYYNSVMLLDWIGLDLLPDPIHPIILES